MRKLFIVLVGIIYFNSLFAIPVDEKTALNVAESFLQSNTKSNLKTGISLSLVYKGVSKQSQNLKSANKPEIVYYYVFNSSNSGFIIVSANDAAMPILGYSNEGIFDPNNIPQNANNWLRGYEAQMQYIADNNLVADSLIRKEWSVLLNEKSSSLKSSEAIVDKLINTIWNQSKFYNDLCPADINSPYGYNGHVPVGCVATAMAQILKYWNYPITGNGSHSYIHNTYGTLTADFGGTTYQWSSMSNNIIEPNVAVATLMFHIGVSLEMNYAPDGSGAYSISETKPDCVKSLKTYFKYSNSTKGIYKINYTDKEWLNLLKTELNAGRPIIYSGTNANEESGHSFIADGYDSSEKMHINWGWGGRFDGWFQINALNPEIYDFNSSNKAIIGIEPLKSTLAVSINSLNITSTANSTATFNITSDVNWTVSCNQTWLKISSANGSNNSKITLTATENSENSERTAVVIVSGTGVATQTITVTQASKSNNLSLSVSNLSIRSFANSTATFNISSDISWIVISDQTWLKVSSKSGSNNSTITLTADENLTNSDRTATVTVSGVSVTSRKIKITQAAKSSHLSISASSLNISSLDKSEATFNISSDISWKVSCSQSWLSASCEDGENSAAIKLTAAANRTASERIATVLITGDSTTVQIVKVTQAAAAAALAVSSKTLKIASKAYTNDSFNITSNIPWIVKSNQTWLKISNASGSDSSTVILTADANPKLTIRTATVTVAGIGVASEYIAVTQVGNSTIVNFVENASISVFPNPAFNNLFVVLPEGCNNASVSIINIEGKEEYSGKISSSNNCLYINALKSGLYSVILKDGNKVYKQKFIKE